MTTSRLTKKAQTTIPKAVRDVLGLNTGDQMIYRIERGCVTLAKARPSDFEQPFYEFSEWQSEDDADAYARF